MPTTALGEFLGTLVLILFGNGVVAGVLLKDSKAEGSGWLVITVGWGIAVLLGVFTAAAFGAPGDRRNGRLHLSLVLRPMII